jgi:hypothetical protein
METVFGAYDAIALTENHIRQLHRDLLAHSTKDERHRGSYKTLPNHVEAFDENGNSLGVVFETATPFDTPRRSRVECRSPQARRSGALPARAVRRLRRSRSLKYRRPQDAS